jgi:hypothetical protein
VKITILRPKKYQSRVYNNVDGENTYYFIPILLEGSDINVKVDQEVIDSWDSIITMDISIQNFDKMRDKDDPKKWVKRDWKRFEVIDFTTIEREAELLEFEIKLRQIDLDAGNKLDDYSDFLQMVQDWLRIFRLAGERNSETAIILKKDLLP